MTFVTWGFTRASYDNAGIADRVSRVYRSNSDVDDVVAGWRQEHKTAISYSLGSFIAQNGQMCLESLKPQVHVSAM